MRHQHDVPGLLGVDGCQLFAHALGEGGMAADEHRHIGAEGQAYGVERLLGDATELRGHDVRTCVTRMIEGALAWNAGEVPLDDISLLVFEAGSPVD